MMDGWMIEIYVIYKSSIFGCSNVFTQKHEHEFEPRCSWRFKVVGLENWGRRWRCYLVCYIQLSFCAKFITGRSRFFDMFLCTITNECVFLFFHFVFRSASRNNKRCLWLDQREKPNLPSNPGIIQIWVQIILKTVISVQSNLCFLLVRGDSLNVWLWRTADSRDSGCSRFFGGGGRKEGGYNLDW